MNRNIVALRSTGRAKVARDGNDAALEKSPEGNMASRN
jgi:hypothetical protein